MKRTRIDSRWIGLHGPNMRMSWIQNELMATLRRHSVASLLALLDETYRRDDWLADCARIRCPVQVIAGSEDGFPTVAMSRRVAETIPGARLHVVQGGPHFPNRTHRTEVQAVIAAFFEHIGVRS